jgi:hypothetical protein
MYLKARTQLAALVLNFASLKLAQYAVATTDSRTVGDVLTFVSTMLTDNNSLNDALAKDLAEKVNNHELIGPGIIPAGNTLFKGSNPIDWDFSIPKEFALFQNYPNPFNPSTTIQYDIPVPGHVLMKLYNAIGQEVEILVDEDASAGRFRIEWDASRLASGVYFYRIRTGAFVATKKLLLLR